MPRLWLVCALLAAAAPVAAQTGADQPKQYRVVTPETPFLHSWRATLDYGNAAGPINDVGSRVGFSRSQEIKAGLEFAVADRGFGRLEVARGWRDTKRTLTFDDLKGEEDDVALGATGGVFILPFVAAGLSFQYRWGDGQDVFTTRAIGSQLVVDRDDRTRRTAPFVLLTAPIGPVRASLIGAYVDLRTDTDYTNEPITSDHGVVKATVVDGALAWRIVPKLEIEGSVGWTHIRSQRVQADALLLDTDVGNAGIRAVYQLTDSIDASLRGSHDFANTRGNAVRFGGGVAYRF